IQTIMNRRTIRKYKEQKVPESIVLKIIELGQRAPTACSLQTYSIIWIKDEKKREKIFEACGKQPFILEAPVTLVICADVRRLIKIMNITGNETSLEKGYGYEVKLFSIIDATLVAQNMVIAAEALGLGSVYIGNALANQELMEILNLPPGVLPLFLLCMGYPDENPPTRPRIPIQTILHIDKYMEKDQEELLEAIKVMVEKLEEEGYYEKYSRRKITWTENVKRKTLSTKEREERIIKNLERAGYLPNQPIK
ncbi:MAG: nitroreductase family protein, partial [Candidatus Methanomethylicia archaeon]